MAAMFDGIIHSFRHSDHDVSIDIIVKPELLAGIVDKTLNHPDVFGQRRHFNADSVHRGLVLIAKALEILVDLILVVGIKLGRYRLEQFYLFFL